MLPTVANRSNARRSLIDVIVFEQDEDRANWTASATTSTGDTIAAGEGPSIPEARARLYDGLERAHARVKDQRAALTT